MSFILFFLRHDLLNVHNFTDFEIAKTMLYGPQHKIKLNPETIEAVCLSATHEFYDNASSGNYNTGDMKLAYEWYDILNLFTGSLLKYSLA